MKYFEVHIALNGKKEVRFLHAGSRVEAMTLTRKDTDGTIIRIKESSLPPGIRLDRLKERIVEKMGRKKVDLKEFSVFLRQLGVMTGAGIPLREAIVDAIAATGNKQVRTIATRVMEDIDAGMSLTDSLKAYEQELGSVTLAMVKTAEMTGRLSESFIRLADMLENIRQNREMLKKAMRMPLISFGALAGAFVFLVLVVVPKFKGIFSKFGADLPLPTQFLLWIQEGLSSSGMLILLFTGALLLLHRRFYEKNEAYALKMDTFLLRSYLIGTITRLSQLERFVMVTAELVSAGIPLTDALDTAAGSVENRFLKARLGSVNVAIRRGASLTEGLAETGLFERMVLQMVKSGESSGQLDTMLTKISEYKKERFQSLVDTIGTLIEPLLIVVVAGMVLLLALGIFLPMWDLASAVRGR